MIWRTFFKGFWSKSYTVQWPWPLEVTFYGWLRPNPKFDPIPMVKIVKKIIIKNKPKIVGQIKNPDR